MSGLYDPARKDSHLPLFLPCCLSLLLTGCQGLGAGTGPHSHSNSPRSGGSLQNVNHIIFMMQENRSFDSYFGKINDYRASLGLGRDADDLETDFTNPTDSPDTQQIRTFHLATSCIYNTTAAWLESHGNANRFDTSDSAPLLLDGFVHTAVGPGNFRWRSRYQRRPLHGLLHAGRYAFALLVRHAICHF